MALNVEAGHGGGGGGGAGGNGGTIILVTTLETKKGIMADGKLVVSADRGAKGTKGNGGGGSSSDSTAGSDANNAALGLVVEIIV
tara:strand:- start:190 stop:444 length:255 start_codon:yes stop_codon:yes gene_type:complete